MKSCSVMCVVGFGAVLCFGFLAIAGAGEEPTKYTMINELLAAGGFAMGLTSWLRLRRGA
ncbi:MAG: hypothetical protein GC186_17275 [Rhodobacteraceae bacterium]|nr:hypothetical protein [Paracoccaceae bacterium]